MFVLPKYVVLFASPSDGTPVELSCAGEEEVRVLVPILLRSGVDNFTISLATDWRQTTAEAPA